MHVRAAPLAAPLRLQAGQERGQALQPGRRAFPSCRYSCAEPRVPLRGVNQQHPEAPWGQSGALGYGQALEMAPCCAGSRGEQPPPSPRAGRAPTGLRDTGMGTAGAWGRVTAPKAGRSVPSQCRSLAALWQPPPGMGEKSQQPACASRNGWRESLHGITVWVPLTRCPVCLWVGDMALSHVLGAARGSAEG